MTLLIILAIIILLGKRTGFKGLFKSKEAIKEQGIEAFTKLKEQGIEYGYIGMFFLFGIFISFYFISMMYIQSFYLTVISILLIIDSLRNMNLGFVYMKDISKIEVESWFYRFTRFAVDIIYIGYVLNWIYLHY